jgi:cold shock CspA family protein
MNAAAPRVNGTLKKWNADRGFGFVVAEHAEQEIFVHVSAFPRDGQPPAIDEKLSFEIELDREGRKRAVRVRRQGVLAPRALRHEQPEPVKHQARRMPRRAESRPWGSLVVAVLLVAGLVGFGYRQYSQRTASTHSASHSLLSTAPAAAPEVKQPVFQCDGRKYCSQMGSCSEAKQFLRNCPDMEMDGDGDGIPCEQQLCTGPFGG